MLNEVKATYLSGKKPTRNQIKYFAASATGDKSLISMADQQQYGATLLHWCAHFDLMAEAKMLLNKGANAKAKTSAEQMPYEWCEAAGLRRLLEGAALAGG